MLHTPIIQQYLKIKNKYKKCFLFYRMGDFYELFYNDAIKINKLLNLTLTKRGFSAGKCIPMAGIPVNSLNNYLKKLINLGETVAICEQINNLNNNKGGPLERKVIRVITPGTLTDEYLLNENKENVISAIYYKNNMFGFSTLEMSTGRFTITELNNKENMLAEMLRINPTELLYPEDYNIKKILFNDNKYNILLRNRPMNEFNLNDSKLKLNIHFGTQDLTCFGIENAKYALPAAGCLFKYAKYTQCNSLIHINNIIWEKSKDIIIIDNNTRLNLELTQNNKNKKNTLSNIINNTVTYMGKRMLNRWLNTPIRNLNIIKDRQKSIFFLKNIKELKDLQDFLKRIGDLERIVSRIALRTAKLSDLIQMRNAFEIFPDIQKILKGKKSYLIIKIYNNINNFNYLYELLKKALIESPINEGYKKIAQGYNKELDELRNKTTIDKNNKPIYIINLEESERKKNPGIKLNIYLNNIYGYFIQIPNNKTYLVPKNYILIQTLKNVKRYTINELKEFENNYNFNLEKIIKLENKIYLEIIEELCLNIKKIKESAISLAELDVISNLAERAISLKYVCPKINNIKNIKIIKGRHPVIENVIQESFIANDININNNNRMLIITGPNMGGKSTYMRQVALIIILTYIGSFVPAEKAYIGPIDRIFTRIGAADDIASKRSTFMVEMTETANILHNATKYSLVLMDEIGRGTSTKDGISIAWACAEYLAIKIKCLTLFATHYFELHKLENKYKFIKNMHFDAIEYNKYITFLYTIKNGSFNKSYGILVAKLAGLPEEVIKKAYLKQNTLNK